MSDARAWVATMVGDPAIPYEDKLGASYEYDSKVQNHKRVAVGDLLFVKSLQSLRGVGRIVDIAAFDGKKPQARCPICAGTASPRTIGGQQKFRCAQGHVVAEPTVEMIDVRKFRADFGAQWVGLERPIPLVEVRKFYIQKSIRMSIIEAERAGLVDYVSSWEPAFARVFPSWTVAPASPGDDADTVDLPARLVIDLDDTRATALRAIKVRRGQPEFRRDLLQLFEGRCAISACTVLGVLEAAHIKPYRGLVDNRRGNGILLRADLHTLFDLDLLGIRPDDLTVCIKGALRQSEYAELDGAKVFAPRGSLNYDCLCWRWHAFQSGE